jgi:predicted dehydrogenase
MKALRTAILGCGGFAHKHAHILASFPDQVEMVAFCNRTLDKAVAFAEQYTSGRAAVFADHHEMLDAVDLDLMVICLPPYAHSDEVERAAEKGIHLLIEKPIALTSEHGWRMVTAAESAGIKTQVGFMYRFGVAIEQLKGMIEAGSTGPVGLMSARYFCNALHAPWWRVREQSGGQFVEQVIHMVDLMRYLLGDPVTVYSRQTNLFHRHVPDYDIEDVSATVFSFASGALGVIYATNGAIPNRWINDYRLVAQKLTAEFGDANHAIFHLTDAPDRLPLTIAADRDYHHHQMADLLQAIRSNSQTRIPLREGALSLDMALAATRSAELGAEVRLGVTRS